MKYRGREHTMQYQAHVEGITGWRITFDVGDESGSVERLLIEPESGNPHREPLSTTSLRRIQPARLLAAASDPWITAHEPVVVEPVGERAARTDEYLASLADAALRLQREGKRHRRNVALGELFGRSASRISDDLRRCREDGWLNRPEGVNTGRALTLRPGPKLLAAWERDGIALAAERSIEHQIKAD